jgi:PAS domain S-box-containing protein
LQRVGRAGAVLVAVAGVVALVGWYAGVESLTTILPGYPPTRPNTAVAFVALGIAVAAFTRSRLAFSLGLLATVVGGATLSEYLLGRSLGIDALLPGIDLAGVKPRMAPATALSLLMLGAALLAGSLGRTRVMRGLAVACFGVGQVAILGYAYDDASLYTVGGYTSMGLLAAAGVVLLSVAILLLDPSAGLVGLLLDRGSAGKLLRPIAPSLLLAPSVLGWLRLWAVNRGWFDTRFGVGALVMGMTVLGGALSWRAGVQLRKVDRQRDAATQALDDTNRSLEATVTERTSELAGRQSFTDALLETVEVGIVSCDANGENFVRNRAERAMVGWSDDTQDKAAGPPARPFDMLDADGHRLTVEQYPLIRTLRGQVVGAVDLLLGPLGGPYREVVVRGSQIVGSDGAVLGAVVSLTDVTSERVSSRELDEEHRRLTEAQRIGQLGSFEHDFVTGTWTFSDQLCALWGVEPGGMVPEVTQHLILEQDRQLAWAGWDHAARLGGRHSYEYRIRRASDGVERLLRSGVEVELGPDGTPRRGHGTHLDVTDVTAAQRAAQRANAFFDAVLTATPDYTFVTDLATGAVNYGSSGKDVLGITSEQLAALGPQAIAALIHPEDQARLRSTNAASAELKDGQVLQLRYRGKHADGGWRWLSRRITPFRRNEQGRVVEVLGVVRDITDVIAAEERLTHAALHDNLTGLPNRSLLVDRLDAALARSERDGREVAVLFCDLDGFKRVNDTAGHAAGDTLLLEVAQRLTAVLRDHDTVARVGGDEFVIIVEPWNRPDGGETGSPHQPGPDTDRAIAVRVAERVADAVRRPVTVDGVEHVVTASIGIAYTQLAAGHAGAVTADQVLQDADAAMYVAKGSGKDRYKVFEHALRTDLAERGRVEQVLRKALLRRPTSSAAPALRTTAAHAHPTLAAAYQPIFESGNGALVGFEALARLTDGTGLTIAPDEFIAIAEATGLIHPLGTVMLDLACGQLHAWRADAPGLEHATMAVNISALQAQHSALGDDVRRALRAHHLAPTDLILELTETALLQAAPATITTLRALHADGVGIAIDDFGVGYASLRYLATLPVTAVKIDRSFTAGLPHDRTSRTIVNAIAGLAADLGLGCVVEGVETAEQLDALPNWVRVQGFFTGRPQPPDQLDLHGLLGDRVP